MVRAYAAGTRDRSGFPGRNYWQLRTDYTIQARLDTVTSVVTGRETVRVYNTSPVVLNSVQLRLDQNLFRVGMPSQANLPAQTNGMVVTELTVDGQSASIGGPGPRWGPWLSGTRSTSERITLATPVAPGSSVRLDLEWHAEVPLDDHGAHIRTGRWGNRVYQLGQWYPRVAMFDDLNGWDVSAYLGENEFFNPFGRFDVRLDLPAGWLAGATGVLQNPEQVLPAAVRAKLSRALESDTTVTIVGPDEWGAGKATVAGNRLVWHFVADSVSDFAWGTSAEYIWSVTRALIPRRGPIPVHFMYTARHAAAYENLGTIVRHGLSFNSGLIMPYAYPQFTLLDGPEGGMEYPMFTMSDGGAIDHELWHQWWPAMVGSNETWYAFMDEGLSTFLAGVTTAARLGVRPTYRSSGGRANGTPLINAADRDPPPPNIESYSRPSRMLSALGEMVGHSEVQRALSEYAQAWRFKHPSPWDFMFFMNRVLGRDLRAFWHSWLFADG